VSDGEMIAFIDRVFTGSKIERSRSFLQEDELFKHMDRETYLSYARSSLVNMGIDACNGAISEWVGNSGDRDEKVSKITHIVWGSMTGGMNAPSIDVELIGKLGLPKRVKRLNVENMGCLTGFRCLALASSLAKEDKDNVVLVVVGDVRSALGNLM
jgi:predicted naringenin-chalcone synthase